MSGPLRIGFIVFPDVTQLDFTGPLQVLSRAPSAQVHIVAAAMDPVRTDTALSIPPTDTFDSCPDLDVICVPGGFGVDAAMRDRALIAFLRRQAAQARYVTSVCTGAFVLGAAGLLKGKRATTHWAYHAELARVGAIPVKARTIRDGNLFTGGGVTAGIDFAFALLEEIAGREAAEAAQLTLEYDPAPPLDAGSPETAPRAALDAARVRYGTRLKDFRAALDRAMAAASA